MSDTSLNRIIQYGTTAERIAFVPDPASGSQVLYLWYDTDNAPDFYAWDGSNWVQLNSGAGAGITDLTGDVTATGPGSAAATIAANAVTNAKLAEMATLTIKGNNTGGTTEPLDLTTAETTAILDALVGDSGAGGTKGLVPAPAAGDAAAGKFLKADATWEVPAGGGGGDLLLSTITLDNGDIQALNSVPADIVAAPGANMIAIPISLSIFMNMAAGYSGTATVRLRYAGIANDLILSTTPISGITNDKFYIRAVVDLTDIGATANDFINKAIQFSSSVDVTGGDGANFMKVALTYYILDLS